MPNNSQQTNSSKDVDADSSADSTGEDITLWRELFEEATQRLTPILKESASGDARRIVEQASGCEPGEFYELLDQQPTVRMVAHFDAMLQRRLDGEPLQYVLGSWAFRYLDLAVDRRVLIPRPETEVVTGFALKELEHISSAIGHDDELLAADLGTGSGCIALSLANENPRVQVYATDKSSEAVQAARANLAGLGRHATRVIITEGSWFEALDPELRGRLALIVSNPPYIADGEVLPEDVAAWEPHEALFSGNDGLHAAREIITESRNWLLDVGVLVLELGETQLEQARQLAQKAGFVDVVIEKDLAGKNRCLIARKAHSSSA